jgi:hypothetical protein
MNVRSALVGVVVAVLVLVGVGAATPARAQGGGPFGLGLMIGSPTGISGKIYLSQRNAIDFAVGGAFLGRRGLHVHADYLWHPVMLVNDAGFFMPLYVGVGVRVLDHGRGRGDDDDVHVGARVPVGILFDFKRVPIDVFLEVALILDFIRDHGDVLDLNAGVGVRYYF